MRPEFLRCRFKHCVRASVTSAVTPETWSRSFGRSAGRLRARAGWGGRSMRR
ncbi:YxiG-like protein [Amycolatopsis japonica]